MVKWSRLPFLAFGMAALLLAIYGGLIRIGWSLPNFQLLLAPFHAPLMVPGFLGTLISLERAVALGKSWGYAAPLFSGLGSLFLILGLNITAASIFICISSLIFVIVSYTLYKKQPAIFTILMGIGTILLLVGNFLWLIKWPVYKIILWWIGMPLLTIVGERLELTRIKRIPTAANTLLLCNSLLYLTGTIISIFYHDISKTIAGIAMVIFAYWLLQYDIAKQTIRQPGLPRFIAIALITGYIWLGISGIIAVLPQPLISGEIYDAFLHTFFIGFTFSMIFGHAPVIFPAILGTQINFKNSFYLHLFLLHASLLLRFASDIIGWHYGRKIGAILNAAAIILFLINTVTSRQKCK